MMQLEAAVIGLTLIPSGGSRWLNTGPTPSVEKANSVILDCFINLVGFRKVSYKSLPSTGKFRELNTIGKVTVIVIVIVIVTATAIIVCVKSSIGE